MQTPLTPATLEQAIEHLLEDVCSGAAADLVVAWRTHEAADHSGLSFYQGDFAQIGWLLRTMDLTLNDRLRDLRAPPQPVEPR